MQVIGSYHDDGYAHVQGLVPPEVARAFLASLKQDVGPQPIPLSRVTQAPNLLHRPAFEIYGFHYKPMLFFLWGLTPVMSELVGRELLPSYDYFRVYREGDVCRVHSDRYSCEHSLSLTLGYSDDKIWDLEIEKAPTTPSARVEEGWSDGDFSSVSMQVGDALLYKGVEHRHGRTKPNPNRWSAHLFLHWVDRDGPFKDHAFDQQARIERVDFAFT